MPADMASSPRAEQSLRLALGSRTNMSSSVPNRHVVQQIQVIVSTNSNLASEYIRQNIGAHADVMVLTRDEDPKKIRG